MKFVWKKVNLSAKPLAIIASILVLATVAASSIGFLNIELSLLGDATQSDITKSKVPRTLPGVRNYRMVSVIGVKPGVLLRSGHLRDIDGNATKILGNYLRNGLIVDLREPGDRQNVPDKPLGVTNKNYPVPGRGSAQGYKETFVDDPAARRQFGYAIKDIANTAGNVLVHCTYGKDRTGWIVAMIMYALGASDSQVMAEYLKSNKSEKVVDRAWLNAGIVEALRQYKSIAGENGYLKKGLGLTDTDINKLRSKFLRQA